MRKINVYRCPICRKPYKTLTGWAAHMNLEHPENRPEGFSDSRYFYYVITGRTSGHCVACGRETIWNEETQKYNRFCGDPKCKERYKDVFDKRMINKYGRTTLCDNPDQQRKMLKARKISGSYKFADGGKIDYVGSYEKDFLRLLDTFFHFKSSDVMGPSPHTYCYKYENEDHFYIPDFFIPNLNLEIEIKDETNAHHKIVAVDRVKEKLKDDVMNSIEAINYFKVTDKDYRPFFSYLLKLKESIPDEDLKADPSMKYDLATEATRLFYENHPTMESAMNACYGTTNTMEAAEESMQDLIPMEDDTPSAYESLLPEEYDALMEQFNDYKVDNEVAQEAIDPITATYGALVFGTVILPMAVMKVSQWWNDEVVPTTAYSKFKSLFVRVKVKNNDIHIKGLDARRLYTRIDDTYKDPSLVHMAEASYSAYDTFLFKHKQINRRDMKITEIHTNEFFAPELIAMLKELFDTYKDYTYAKAARLIYEKTWLSKADNNIPPEVDTSVLNGRFNEKYKLLPYQDEFIRAFNQLKHKLNLRGYILAFEQGLGKTFTATALMECLNKKRVYIVCPNSVTENWANEIKGYFKCYNDNDDKWHEDVGIVGSKRFPIGKHAKYIICNNEGLDKLMPYIDVSGSSVGLIVDESHNFRNYKGARVQQLVSAAKKMDSNDILLCSGTPIKAVPNEIVPSLMLLDPLMTPENARLYTKCFALDNMIGSKIVKARFNNVIYRKTKSELNLPEKYVIPMYWEIKDPTPYLMDTVADQTKELFVKNYEEAKDSNKECRERYKEVVRKYSTAGPIKNDHYFKWLVRYVNTDKSMRYRMDADMEFLDSFLDTYVYPNLTTDGAKKEFNDAFQKFMMMRQSCMGKAVGAIVPKARAEMFKTLYLENKEKVYAKIKDSPKKTVIFSWYLPVVNTIVNDLNSTSDIKAVKVVGGMKDRFDVIDQFKYDDTVDVLVATPQTLGTGVTLTEANQMFFFGTPWRSADFDQCCDRIHRIGQTSSVYIFNILLKSQEKNLSSRIDEIMQWSGDMFGAMINENGQNTLQETVSNASESTIEVVDEVTNAYLPSILEPISGEANDDTQDYDVNTHNEVATPDPEAPPVAPKNDKREEAERMIRKFALVTPGLRKQKAQEIYSFIMNNNIDIDLRKYKLIAPLLDSPITTNKSSDKVFEGFIFTTDEKLPQNLMYSPSMESTNCNYSKRDYQAVYVVCMHSRSVLANIVKAWTHDEFSHAALSLEPDLNPMYTFGNKSGGGHGFSIETPDNPFFIARPTMHWAVYAVFVNPDEMSLIKERLLYFMKRDPVFRFDLLGLTNIAFGKAVEKETKYFCSGFVADVLQAGNKANDRSYSLYKPQDLADKFASYEVARGEGLQNINPEEIKRNTEKMRDIYFKNLNK